MYNNSYIIHQLSKGNKKVYEELFTNYYPILMRFAEGYVFRKDVCEDIVQDFFVWLWENRATLNMEVSLQSYFYQSIKNKCLDYLKHLRVKDKYRVLFIQASVNAEMDSEEENEDDLYRKMDDIINQMPTQMAEIIKAKYFKSLKTEEIASNYNISVNTVKTQLARGRKKIKDLISCFLYLSV